MKRWFDGQIILAVILIGLSAFFYLFDYLIFKDAHRVFLSLIDNIAFLFVYVLIVTLVLERLLEYRDKRLVLKKLNMVIGSFFIEVGTELIKKSIQFDGNASDMGRELIITKDWSDKDFKNISNSIRKYISGIDSRRDNLAELKEFLLSKRQFLLSLLENPNLLEHESFSDMLWAVFHLTDELAHRHDLTKLSEADYQHLSVDMTRACQYLILQWLEYMKHLKHDYPYLFSLAMRTNPFDKNASVEIK